jgi:hypothetical protein
MAYVNKAKDHIRKSISSRRSAKNYLSAWSDRPHAALWMLRASTVKVKT